MAIRITQPTRLVFGLLLAVPALTAGAAHGQTDLSGTWTLQASVELPDEGGTCEYSGETTLTQDQGSVSGFAELLLVAGPPECPAEMSAALEGETEAGDGVLFISGVLAGQLGTTLFTGEITPNPGGSGTFDVSQGPFSGSTGTWSAELLLGLAAVPDLTPVGLTLLTLLLLGAGSWFLARQSG